MFVDKRVSNDNSTNFSFLLIICLIKKTKLLQCRSNEKMHDENC